MQKNAFLNGKAKVKTLNHLFLSLKITKRKFFDFIKLTIKYF